MSDDLTTLPEDPKTIPTEPTEADETPASSDAPVDAPAEGEAPAEAPATVADDADSAAPAEDAPVEPAPAEVDAPLESVPAEQAASATSTDAPAGPEGSAPTTSDSFGSASEAPAELPHDAAADQTIEAPAPVGDDTLPGTPAETDILSDVAAPTEAAPESEEPVKESEPAPTEAAPDEDVAKPLDGNDIPVQTTPEAPVLEALANSESEDVGKPLDPAAETAKEDGKDTSQVVLPSLVADQVGAPVNIEESPKLEDVVAQRPLTSQVVEETRGAHDAVPDEAQKFMASIRPFAGDKRDPGPGQLPGNQAFAGTQEDATGVSQSIPTLAHHPDAAIDPLTEDGTELKDDAAAEDAAGDESEDDDFGGESEEGFDGEDDDSDEAASEAGGIFGEPRIEVGPLFSLAGDGLHDLKAAAEAGQSAQLALQQVPLHLLEVEHRDQIFRLRQIIGELLTLTGHLFQRNG